MYVYFYIRVAVQKIHIFLAAPLTLMKELTGVVLSNYAIMPFCRLRSFSINKGRLIKVRLQSEWTNKKTSSM